MKKKKNSEFHLTRIDLFYLQISIYSYKYDCFHFQLEEKVINSKIYNTTFFQTSN